MLNPLFFVLCAGMYLAGWIYLICVRPLWLFSVEVTVTVASLSSRRIREYKDEDMDFLIGVLNRITWMYWILYAACFFGVWLNICGLSGVLPSPSLANNNWFLLGSLYMGGLLGVLVGFFFTIQEVTYCRKVLTALGVLKPKYQQVDDVK